VSLEDARRGLEMFRQLKVPVLGIVENMSYLELPSGEKMEIFGSGGGEKLAKATETPFIGGIPMDQAVREGGDTGMPVVLRNPDSKVSQALNSLAADVSLKSGVLAIRNQSAGIPISIVN
jgi:ATP-binding protein involved in chromosome partitioning